MQAFSILRTKPATGDHKRSVYGVALDNAPGGGVFTPINERPATGRCAFFDASQVLASARGAGFLSMARACGASPGFRQRLREANKEPRLRGTRGELLNSCRVVPLFFQTNLAAHRRNYIGGPFRNVSNSTVRRTRSYIVKRKQSCARGSRTPGAGATVSKENIEDAQFGPIDKPLVVRPSFL